MLHRLKQSADRKVLVPQSWLKEACILAALAATATRLLCTIMQRHGCSVVACDLHPAAVKQPILLLFTVTATFFVADTLLDRLQQLGGATCADLGKEPAEKRMQGPDKEDGSGNCHNR